MTLDAIQTCLADALTADLVLSTGGASVGEYDFLKEAMSRLGVQLLFSKVKLKPGKPITFGLANGTPVFALPGNPISAMVTFEIFVRPAIRKMLGDPQPHPPVFNAELQSEYMRRPGRLELARAYVERGETGLRASMASKQGSGDFSSVVGTNALVILPAEEGHFKAGAVVEVIPWSHPWGEYEARFIELISAPPVT